MKFITILLALLVTFLTCTPCVDSAEVPVHAKELAENGAGHSHDTNDDACSPFCICSCCGVQILNFTQPVTYVLFAATAEIETKEPSFKSVFISDYFGSIWQPPQIV